MRIVTFSDGPSVPTGFGTVVRNIFEPMIDSGFLRNDDVSFFSINYDGSPTGLPFRQWPALSGMAAGDRDPYGRARFIDMVVRNVFGHIDLIFFLLDHFSLSSGVQIGGQMVPFVPAVVQLARQQPNRAPFRVIQYVPVDSESVRPEWLAWMPGGIVDKAVAYTEFGKRILLDTCPSLRDIIGVIPHGTSPERFFTVPESVRNDFRRKVFNIGPEVPLVVNCNRNQPRKDIVRTLQAFANVKQRIPQAKLYLHMNVTDSMGFNLDRTRADLRLPAESVIFPQGFSEGVGVPVEALNLIHNAADVEITTARGEGWGLCVESGTPIDTPSGPKRMGDIVPGDKVLTRDGYKRVLDKISRESDTLTVRAHAQQQTTVTPEHPYYCIPLTLKQALYHRRRKPESRAQWVCAKDLKPGWLLGTPRPHFCVDIPKSIDLTKSGIDLGNAVERGDFLEIPMGFSPHGRGISIQGVSAKYGVSKRVAEDALGILGLRTARRRRFARLGSRSSVVAQHLFRHHGEMLAFPRRVAVRRNIELTDDVLEFLGWYIAEGSSEGGVRVDFSLHAKELPVAERLNKIAKDSFGCDTGKITIRGNRLALRIGSSILARFLSGACGFGAANKRIPDWLFGCKAGRLIPLLRGVFLGDGHCIDTVGWSLATVSFQLAYQVRTVLVSLGVGAGVSCIPRRNGTKDIFMVYVGGADAMRLAALTRLPIKRSKASKRRIQRHTFLTEDFIWFPIRKIEKSGVKSVQDISVEGTHEFVGGGLLLHNTVTEAMCVGTPVIAPDHTSFSELLADGRGILAPPERERQIMIADNDQLRPVADVTKMADAVVWALEHRDEARAIGQRGKEWAVKLSWKDNVSPQWQRLFQEVVAPQRAKVIPLPKRMVFNVPKSIPDKVA